MRCIGRESFNQAEAILDSREHRVQRACKARNLIVCPGDPETCCQVNGIDGFSFPSNLLDGSQGLPTDPIASCGGKNRAAGIRNAR